MPLTTNGTFSSVLNAVGQQTLTSLETVATKGLTLPYLLTFINAGELQDWVLTAGTAANDRYHQRPTDFDAATNPVMWVRSR